MKVTFVDLRTETGRILRALERNEPVTISYRGSPKAVMQPIGEGAGQAGRAKDHPAFGLWKDRDDWKNVAERLRALRQGRFHAL